MADVSKIITVTEIKTLRSSKNKNHGNFVKQEFTLTGLPLVCWNLLGHLRVTRNPPPLPQEMYGMCLPRFELNFRLHAGSVIT